MGSFLLLGGRRGFSCQLALVQGFLDRVSQNWLNVSIETMIVRDEVVVLSFQSAEGERCLVLLLRLTVLKAT